MSSKYTYWAVFIGLVMSFLLWYYWPSLAKDYTIEPLTAQIAIIVIPDWQLVKVDAKGDFEVVDTSIGYQGHKIPIVLVTLNPGIAHLSFRSTYYDTFDTIVLSVPDSTVVIKQLPIALTYEIVYHKIDFVSEPVKTPIDTFIAFSGYNIKLDTTGKPNIKEALIQYGSVVIKKEEIGCFHYQEEGYVFKLVNDSLEMTYFGPVTWGNMMEMAPAPITSMFSLSYLDTLKGVNDSIFYGGSNGLFSTSYTRYSIKCGQKISVLSSGYDLTPEKF